MASAGSAHSDDHRLAFSCEADPDQLGFRVTTVHLGAEDSFELLSLQRFEGPFARLALESRSGGPVEPAERLLAVAAADGAEKRRHDFFRTGRWLLRTAEAERSNQEPSRKGESQVPEQDGANSSSSAADTNSSLHQNDARE